MDAADLNKLIARQLEGDDDGPTSRTVEVTFRKSGDTAKVTLRRLTPSEKRRAVAWSMTEGEIAEGFAMLAMAGLRWAVVDDDGRQAFSSYDQARQFVDVIDQASYRELGEAMAELGPLLESETGIATEEDPEAGKAS